MKAKEYYAKYKDRIASLDDGESIQAICDMVTELSIEAKSVCDKRNVRTDCGGTAVLREMNDKYNAVCRMFEKEYGVSPIIKDGFMTYWRRQIPALDIRMRRKEIGGVFGSF